MITLRIADELNPSAPLDAPGVDLLSVGVRVELVGVSGGGVEQYVVESWSLEISNNGFTRTSCVNLRRI